MQTHYSLEADAAASYRETGSEICVREHHLPAHGVRAEALLIVSVVSFVLLCLLDTRAVDEVAFGADGIAGAEGRGKVLVDHSSISPDATRTFEA